MKKVLALFFTGTLAVLLLYVVTLLPPMGDAGNPTNHRVIPRYLEHGEHETGTRNIVAGIVFNYRGYDTMGEVAIFSAALAGVFAVLGVGRKKIAGTFIDQSAVKFSFISRTTVILLLPFIILFSIYVILYGLDLPGGGFQGAAIIGAGVVVFIIAFGYSEGQRRLPHKVRIILESTAISAFFLIGTVGVIGGGNFLTYILPQLSTQIQATLRTLMLLVLLFGVGIKGGMVFTSILFALLREEQ